METTLKSLDTVIKASLIGFVLFSMFSISVSQISLGLGGLAWFVKLQLTRSWKEQFWPIGIPVLFYVVACLLAVAFAVDPDYSYKSLKKLLQILIFFWVLNTVRDEKHRDFLITLLIISGCVAASYGFYQFLVTELTESTRVAGTMSIYMTFAGILMLVGLLASGRFVFRRPREKWVAGAVGLILFCLLLTLTRQAWLGFFAGSLFLVTLWRVRFLLAVPIIAVMVYFLSPSAVQSRIHSMVNLNDWTLQARIALWKGGWNVFKDYPVTGCGFRCMDLVHPDYPDPTGYIEKYRGMHNNFVQIAVDTGILGLISWMSIWAAYFWQIFRRYFQAGENDSLRWVVTGSGAAVVGFLAGGMFEVNFYDSEVAMLLFFIMALPFCGQKQKPDLVNGTNG